MRLTRLPRHDRGPVPGGNRSAATCLCTVLRRALYHYATRTPAIFLVHEKVTQGASKSADYRAYRHIAPKSLELVVVSQPVAEAFCGRLLLQHLQHATYFDPGTDWPKSIELNATFPIVLEQLAFLGDTRSRRELLVFAQANPSRLSLTMESSSPRYLSGEWPASATQSSMTRWSVFFAVS